MIELSEMLIFAKKNDKLFQVKTQTSLFNAKEIVELLKIWLKNQFFPGGNLWPGFWEATKRQVGEKPFPH